MIVAEFSREGPRNKLERLETSSVALVLPNVLGIPKSPESGFSLWNFPTFYTKSVKVGKNDLTRRGSVDIKC